MNRISEFRGKYSFLSNFYFTEVKYEDIVYTSVEAAFQAQKTANLEDRKIFIGVNPSEAKRLGRRVKLRDDWEDIKLDVMYNVVKAKFDQHSILRVNLLETRNAELVEDNNWGDTYWGVCNGVGENNLGKILMKIRDEYIKEVN